MKRSLLFVALAAAAALSLSSCRSKAPAAAQTREPFGKTFKMPCDIKDSKENYAATGIYRGSYLQKGEVHINALENAKAVIRSKVHHAYKGMISDYSGTIGSNRGNDIATKLERAGDATLDLMFNDAHEVCVQYSEVFDDGMIECYVAIEISKAELAQRTSKRVADVLTQDEKNRIRFDEQNYRRQMEERMRQFNEDQQQ